MPSSIELPVGLQSRIGKLFESLQSLNPNFMVWTYKNVININKNIKDLLV